MNIMRFVIPKSLVEYVTVDSTVRQALEKMRFHRYAAIPVIDGEGRYVGMLRNDDIFTYFLDSGSFDTKSAERDRVTDIMSGAASAPLYHNSSMDELIEQVKEHNFVPVVDDRGCFVGLILRRDILNFLFNHYSNNEKRGGIDGR
ncbi:MAG: CBS domain-containing protein [Clostridia bacterium]|nr:CBS domain-containing protein [Clostridia bacterium]